MLDNLVEIHKQDSRITVAGDLNTTFVPFSALNLVTKEETEYWGVPQMASRPQSDFTKTALQPATLVVAHRLRARNGRTRSDLDGACTFRRGCQTSVID
ncbi:hypothetical protein NDU88_007002 [Pleurodeles waltl]|uniref:Endonuclease/exonuclease/phosphatase domain-containing protein n=1 Tax=Pleurodeles waltl TaxID=8319 RepID=A0AAV7VNG3_PLEWA|nr:hypothetical protein NDU88_007002 [Pleurodeles waltl]